MLKIKIADIPIDLKDTKLSVVLTSPFPFMAAGQQGGNYIFNFSVPATPALKKLYLHAHRPGSGAGRVELPYDIDAFGIKYKGLAQLSEASDESYEVFCPLGTGDFNSRAKEIRLPELDYGGDVSLPSSAFFTKTTVDYSYNEYENFLFTKDVVIAFNEKISNTSQLNAEGTMFTSDGTQSISFIFNMNSDFYTSVCELRMYKNDVLEKSFSLVNGKQIHIHTVSLIEDDEITWKLHLASKFQYGFHWITGVLFAGCTLTISNPQANSSLRDAAVNRYPDINYAVFPMHNPFAFDKWPDDEFSVDNQNIKTIYGQFVRVVNYWFANDFPETMTITGEDEEEFTAGNLFVPFPYIAFIIHRIADRFGFRIENNVFDDELKYAVLINHFLENRFLNETILEANETLNLNDHVPDWSVYDFLQNVCKLFGLGYEVDNETSTITFTFLKDLLTTSEVINIAPMVVSKPRVDFNNYPSAFSLQQKYPSECKLSGDIKSLKGLNLKGAVPNFADLPATGEVNDVYLVGYYNSYYAWNYNPDTYEFQWGFHSHQYTTEISSGDDAIDISTDLPSVLSRRYMDIIQPLATNRLWTLPSSHQVAQFEGAPDIYQGDWKPLVVWYHGLKNDSLGQTYPYANADMVDHAGNEIAGVPFSLHLGGSRGTYNLLWKAYLQWRTTAKPVRVQMIPDRAFLRNFRFSKKLRLGGVNYLVVEARGNIGKLGPLLKTWIRLWRQKH
jgi:hypothetical protein